MTCKKCGHKFCWRCLQERPRESDAHDCQVLLPLMRYPADVRERDAGACKACKRIGVGGIKLCTCLVFGCGCALHVLGGQGAPDVSAFDPSVQNLIRRVLQNYDPAVETKSTLITNPLAADAASIVTFATTYLVRSKEAITADQQHRMPDGGAATGGAATGGAATGVMEDGPSAEHPPTADKGTLAEVHKVIARLRRLWEGRAAMFEALAQEQEPEAGGADGVPLLQRRLQRRREDMQAMMLDGFGGDDFDAFDWRLRTHRRMQRREQMEQELQRHARERDEEQRLAIRRILLQQLTSNLAGVSGEEMGEGGEGGSSEEVSQTGCLSAEEVCSVSCLFLDAYVCGVVFCEWSRMQQLFYASCWSPATRMLAYDMHT